MGNGVTRERSSSDSVSNVPLKKQKLKEAKDAPKFEKGNPKGEVLFPPYETDGKDGELERQLRRFDIYPRAGIDAYPRHIPYTSDKKSFLARTGKVGFEGKHLPISRFD